MTSLRMLNGACVCAQATGLAEGVAPAAGSASPERQVATAFRIALVRPDLLRQQDVVEAELLLLDQVCRGELIERPRRYHRKKARRVDEGPRVRVGSDAEHALLAARHPRLFPEGEPICCWCLGGQVLDQDPDAQPIKAKPAAISAYRPKRTPMDRPARMPPVDITVVAKPMAVASRVQELPFRSSAATSAGRPIECRRAYGNGQ